MAKRKRSNGEGTIIDKGNGRFMGQISVGRDPVTGKLKRKTVYGTKEEVEKKLLNLRYELINGSYMEETNITMEKWLLTWLNVYKKNKLGPGTFDNYETNIINHIIPNIGKVELKKLRTDHLQIFYNKLLVNGNKKTGKELSPKTIRRVHVIINAALEQAIKVKHINENVSKYVELLKIENKEFEYLNSDEITQFLNYCDGDRFCAAFVLECYTGVRRGELLGLRWQDVSFDKDQIRINQVVKVVKNRDGEGNKTKLIFGTPKTRSSRRTIPVPENVISILKEYQKQQNEEKMLIGKRYKDNDLLFCKVDGTPIRPQNFTNHFKRLLKESGVEKKVRFHDLRHSVASLLLELDQHPKVVQELLGHSVIATTLDIYSHVTLEKKSKATSSLHNLYTKTS